MQRMLIPISHVDGMIAVSVLAMNEMLILSSRDSKPQ